MLDQAADAALEALSKRHHLDPAPRGRLLLGLSLCMPQVLSFLHGAGENLCCLPDIADLILTGLGLRQVVVAGGEFLDGLGHAPQRLSDLSMADKPADEKRNEGACQRNRDEQHQTLIIKLGCTPLDSGDLLAAPLSQGIDADLEGFPVGAVGIVVALRVGGTGETSAPRWTVSERNFLNSAASLTTASNSALLSLGTIGSHSFRRTSMSFSVVRSPSPNLRASVVSFAA